MRKIFSGIKHGDMDFGSKDTVFDPFMGVTAATLLS